MIIAGLLEEILTGLNRKANNLALERRARRGVGNAKRVIEKQLIEFKTVSK